MKKTLLILLAISLIHAQSIEIKPEIKEKQKTEHQTVQYDIYTGQSLKISTPGGFESFHLTLNSDVSDINHPLCKVVERQIKFENVTYLNIYEGQFDSHGLLMNEIPITIGWTSIKPNIKNTNKGIASLDDSLDLYIFMIDDILDKDYYGSQLLGRISMKELYPDYKMLEDEVFLVEARGIIFMFFQSKLIMYDTIKKTKNLVPGYKGDKELKKVLVYYFGQVTMFYIAHGLGGFSAYKMNHAPGLENISLELLFDSDVNNDKKMNIVDINMYEYKMTLNKQEISMMSIYVLDYNSGLHLYDQNFADDIIEPKDIQKKTSVFIPYEQGILFGMYKDETFLIVGSEFGNYVATEIEFDEQANEYFINRKHEVENEIQDILVAENYAILLGSNTHTIIWHSVNSKIIQDMSPLYSQFSLYGYNGGVFFEGPYDERLGKSVDFFAGLQRRHLFVVKIIEQDPYFECDASDQQIQDLVGNHNLLFDVKYNCPTIEEPNSNSYCSHTQKLILSVKKVYADSDNAGVIVGIFFGVLGTIAIFGTVLFCMYKNKIALKSSLQVEINNLLNKKKAENNQYQQLDKEQNYQQQQGVFESDKIKMNRFGGQNAGTYPEIERQSFPDFQQPEDKRNSNLKLVGKIENQGVNKDFQIDIEKDNQYQNNDQVINFNNNDD